MAYVPRKCLQEIFLKIQKTNLEVSKKFCFKHPQDSSLVVPLGPNKLLVGVFDGHGEQGAFKNAHGSNVKAAAHGSIVTTTG